MPSTAKRPTTGTFAPPSTSPLAAIEASLNSLLTATEPHEPSAPAAKAFRAAMRARGQEAAAAGGTEALDYLMIRLTEVAPDRAEAREAILEAAWAGVPGWRS